MASILPYQRREPQPAQLSFFEEDDQSYTNTIDMLDVAPRWVIRTDQDVRQGQRFLDSIERNFVHNGKHFSLTLRPARIKGPDGLEREEYPGTREQIVEQVIRKIATSPDRLREMDGEIRLTFSINEVRCELTRRNHQLRFDEIKESLSILHGAIIEIRRVDATGVTKELSSSAFPQLSFASSSIENTESTLQFNWLVTEAIKRLQFRQLNYEIMMQLKDPIAMWLFSSLSQRAMYGNEGGNVQEVTAMDIQRDCGLNRWKAHRNMLNRITKAIGILQQHGVIDSYDEQPVKEGKKKVDINYVMVMSSDFLSEMRRSNERSISNVEDYRKITGQEPISFEARLDAAKRHKLRSMRNRNRIA